MSDPVRPTKRERRRMTRFEAFGKRPTNGWNAGDLPAPFAVGDLLWLPERYDTSRLNGMGDPGWYVVCFATSIGEDDAWYFRVTNDPEQCSDRLHVVCDGRTDPVTIDPVDWMAPFELIDTADPAGLGRRQQMLTEGWSYEPPHRCEACGQKLPGSEP